MKLFMYIPLIIALLILIPIVRKEYNIPDSKIRKPILIVTLLLSLLGYLCLPYLGQKLLVGCLVDQIIQKTTYVTGDKTRYFYVLDSGFSTWSNSNLNEGDFICSPKGGV